MTTRRYIRQFQLEKYALRSAPSNSVNERKLRNILSRKTERVQLTASSIHPKDRRVYSRKLIEILSDETKNPDVRHAAADALNFVGDARIYPLRPVMVKIPAGRSAIGISEKRAIELAKQAGLPSYSFQVETPDREANLPDYKISCYLITNMEYLQFVRDTSWEPPSWWSGTIVGPSFLPWKANHPVWGIGWDDAMSYCKWLSKKTGKKYRLPTENEWEKTARGTDGRNFPWGNNYMENRCNTSEEKNRGTTPVGVYFEGASQYGVMDMAGNVEEWTMESPNKQNCNLGKRIQFLRSKEYRITKSGGWRDSWYTARCSFKRIRSKDYNVDAGGRIGFRLVRETY